MDQANALPRFLKTFDPGAANDPKQFARYIDEIDSPWVGVHFDMGVTCVPLHGQVEFKSLQ